MSIVREAVLVLRLSDVITSLFRQTAFDPWFHGSWIPDDQLATAIKSKFAIEASSCCNFTFHDLNAAVKKDPIFKASGDVWSNTKHAHMHNFFKRTYKQESPKKRKHGEATRHGETVRISRWMYYFVDPQAGTEFRVPHEDIHQSQVREYFASNQFVLSKIGEPRIPSNSKLEAYIETQKTVMSSQFVEAAGKHFAI